jgi:hypothetical protein
MGTIEFNGFSEADRRALIESWKLKAGDVYDASYIDRFFREDARPVLSRIFQARRPTADRSSPLDSQVTPDRKSLTVNVAIELKN